MQQPEGPSQQQRIIAATASSVRSGIFVEGRCKRFLELRRSGIFVRTSILWHWRGRGLPMNGSPFPTFIGFFETLDSLCTSTVPKSRHCGGRPVSGADRSRTPLRADSEFRFAFACTIAKPGAHGVHARPKLDGSLGFQTWRRSVLRCLSRLGSRRYTRMGDGLGGLASLIWQTNDHPFDLVASVTTRTS